MRLRPDDAAHFEILRVIDTAEKITGGCENWE